MGGGTPARLQRVKKYRRGGRWGLGTETILCKSLFLRQGGRKHSLEENRTQGGIFNRETLRHGSETADRQWRRWKLPEVSRVSPGDVHLSWLTCEWPAYVEDLVSLWSAVNSDAP